MSAPTEPTAQVAIHFDVNDVNASCDFYNRTLGFRVTATLRPGPIFETRTLRSTRFPAVALTLREGFGKRVGGTQPGGVTRLSLAARDLASEASVLAGKVTWIGKAPDPAALPPTLNFIDPDGYQIELFPLG